MQNDKNLLLAQAEAYVLDPILNALVDERLRAISGNDMDGSPRTNAELLRLIQTMQTYLSALRNEAVWVETSVRCGDSSFPRRLHELLRI